VRAGSRYRSNRTTDNGSGCPTSSFEPSVHIDITGYEQQKLDAVERHESQVEFLTEHGGIDAEFDNLLEGIRAEETVRGKKTGVSHAEGFRPLHERTSEYLN